MSEKRYRTIVADPPWAYDEGFAWKVGSAPDSRIVRQELPYGSMTLREIKAINVADLADRDCRLWLWTTNRYLRDAFDVMDAWGFTYRQIVVWDKRQNFQPLGGSVAPNAAEFLLVGTRGHPAIATRLPANVVSASRQIPHSRKPEAFLDYIEAAGPGPFLEMFSRRARLGWDTWGNEALEHVDLTPEPVIHPGQITIDEAIRLATPPAVQLAFDV